jgi:alpha-glucan,water dikinase
MNCLGWNSLQSATLKGQMDAVTRELLYLDLALESVVRSAAERGSRAAGAQASPLVGPLLENLVLSTGNNEELCYCLKAWQDLSGSVQAGNYPSKEEALKVSRV